MLLIDKRLENGTRTTFFGRVSSGTTADPAEREIGKVRANSLCRRWETLQPKDRVFKCLGQSETTSVADVS